VRVPVPTGASTSPRPQLSTLFNFRTAGLALEKGLQKFKAKGEVLPG